MISSPNRSARGNARVRLVVLHTAEGATTTTSLGNYFANPAVQASSHVGIDDRGVEQYVPYTEAAWTVRSANPISDNAELCGFAKWTRDQWMGQHRPMLDRAAAWVRERCLARGIPIVKLTPAQVAAGQAGVIGHVDWTQGMRDGTHTDPGAGFPWDYVIAAANGGSTSGGPFMALSDNEQAELLALARNLNFQMFTGPDPQHAGWPTFAGGTGEVLTVVDYLRRLNVQVKSLADRLSAIETGKSGPASLSPADYQNIAAAVVSLLGKKASA